MAQSDGANGLVGGLAVLRKKLRCLQAGIAVCVQVTDKVVAVDERELAGLQCLYRDFIRLTGYGGMQPKDFTRLCHLQNESLSVFVGCVHFGAALAKYVHTIRRLSFQENNCAFGETSGVLNPVEVGQRILG